MLAPVWARRLRRELDAVQACDDFIHVAHTMLELIYRETYGGASSPDSSNRVIHTEAYSFSCAHPYCYETDGHHFDTVIWVCSDPGNCACRLDQRGWVHRLYLAPANFTPAEAEIYKVLRADGLLPHEAATAAPLLAA